MATFAPGTDLSTPRGLLDAVDLTADAWREACFILADHEGGCRECRQGAPCFEQIALHRSEIGAWGRFYDARRDAGVL